MRYVTCSLCQADQIPQNSALRVDGALYCENCLKETFPDDGSLKNRQFSREYDPTVCFNCAQDFGERPLEKLGSYPVCRECDEAIKQKVFPAWVKAFFAGVLILVVFSFVWNWRFIHAHFLLKEMDKTVAAGDLDAAAAHFHTIAENVPEIEDFTLLSEFYRGLTLLRDDRPAEAVKAFENSVKLPEGYQVPRYLLQANVGAAYDNRDYRNFLKFSKQGLVYDTSATAWAMVASAYSCLYVTEKSDSLLTSTQLYVDKARLTGDTTRELAAYLNLIEYRVAMDQIIDRKDFEEKFPNGWPKN